jgi:hypothetical protein
LEVQEVRILIEIFLEIFFPEEDPGRAPVGALPVEEIERELEPEVVNVVLL